MQPFLFLLASFVVVVAQCTLANLVTWGGARLELMPALVAYAAMSTRWPLALALALVGGVFLDALSANRLGISSVALVTVAFIGSRGQRLVLRDHWSAQMLVGGLASLLASLVLCSSLAVGGLGWMLSLGGVARVAQVALMSLIAAPLLFRALDIVRERLGEERMDGLPPSYKAKQS